MPGTLGPKPARSEKNEGIKKGGCGSPMNHGWINGSMDQCSKEKWRLKAPYFDGENPWQPSIVPSTNLLTVGVRGDTSKSWDPKKNRSNTKHTRGFIGEGITVPGLIKTR